MAFNIKSNLIVQLEQFLGRVFKTDAFGDIVWKNEQLYHRVQTNGSPKQFGIITCILDKYAQQMFKTSPLERGTATLQAGQLYNIAAIFGAQTQ